MGKKKELIRVVGDSDYKQKLQEFYVAVNPKPGAEEVEKLKRMYDTIKKLQSHPGAVIEFEYTNWKGETRQRKAKVQEITFGASEWHPRKQYLLTALDLEKDEIHNFAVLDMENTRFLAFVPKGAI